MTNEATKAPATDSPRCPNCGSSIPAETLGGLCPRCLLFQAAMDTNDGEGSATRPAPPDIDAVRAAFPQLEVIELIGHGGMGAVYKARQKSLNRLVAIKLLTRQSSGQHDFEARFTREARALAELNHPNIVTIHDFGQAAGFYFLLMEYVDGVNLRQAMNAGRMLPAQALSIVPPVCEALTFAHERGIVHRDIKPENLLLDREGRVKIVDFGIARIVRLPAGERSPHIDSGRDGLNSDVQLTGDVVLGTPNYMAPEQKLQAEAVDQRADVYSLGVVLYEMLTGELPLGNFEMPSRKVQVDVRLDEIVLRALDHNPELRWPTTAALKAQLETLSVSDERPGSPALREPDSTTHRGFTFAATSVILFMLVAVFTTVFLSLHFLAVSLLLYVVMSLVAALLMLMRNDSLSERSSGLDKKRQPQPLRWLAWAGALLAVPVGGFGIFLFLAVMSDPSWHPIREEAIISAIAWFGTIALPISAWWLFRTTGRLRTTATGTTVTGIIALLLAIVLPIIGFGHHFAQQSRQLHAQSQKLTQLNAQLSAARESQALLRQTPSVNNSKDLERLDAMIKSASQRIAAQRALPAFGSLGTAAIFSVVGILLGACGAVILIFRYTKSRVWRFALSALTSLSILTLGAVVLAAVIDNQLEFVGNGSAATGDSVKVHEQGTAKQ